MFFWDTVYIYTVCPSISLGDCSIVEHYPQRKLDLQQLSTATGGHRADQWVMTADVVWTAGQTEMNQDSLLASEWNKMEEMV